MFHVEHTDIRDMSRALIEGKIGLALSAMMQEVRPLSAAQWKNLRPLNRPEWSIKSRKRIGAALK